VDARRDLLRRTAEAGADFLESLERRPVFPAATYDELLATLGGPLADGPSDPRAVIDELVAGADPGLVASASGRYFGFVVGGAVPAALAADWLTSAWDQNAGGFVLGPSAMVVESVAGEWLRELLMLPPGVSFAFVTGCQMAHVTCLAAARLHVLRAAGWDVNVEGLAGGPPVRVVVGAKRHVTIDRALRLLGVGSAQIAAVEADGQGRMRPNALRTALADGDRPTIVCAQAGEVNTGSFDPLPEIADAAEEVGAWLHVDGAFGLWAAASPSFRELVAGHDRADSWATDAHKWLNVPYDSGLAFCRHPDPHLAAMTARADYLVVQDETRDAVDYTPEFSRRARGFPVYAALRSLGRSGVADLVDRACANAARLADELARIPGAVILNEVVLNQVLFRFETDERTAEILQLVQESGEAWMSGTTWDGRAAIRISVSNWQTSDEDVAGTVAAFERAAAYGNVPAR
jgi:glutamate/tyrosine decarboxylase-like PLP-dependent enzyme